MSVITSAFRPCALIPCYNHGETLQGVVSALVEKGLDCLIVDDGSDLKTQQYINEISRQYPQCKIIHSPENKGKGAALAEGFRLAYDLAYSHALQVDADGQHDLDAVIELLAMAEETPNWLISGKPVYDESVPKSRLYGRYITHFWVWVETLSFSLKDSMCGFRVYPLAQTLAVLNRYPIGQRMDFDTEIMVRLYWDGTGSRFLPTRVSYPETGISHFDVVKDNIRISKMHARLFFGMLSRILPLLRHKPVKHWAQTNERKGLLGMRFMLKAYNLLGRKPFEFILFFVAGWFWLTGGEQGKASRDYLKRIRRRYQELGLRGPSNLNSYRHFFRFGNAMLDKISSWSGKLVWGRDVEFAPEAETVLTAPSSCGKLILASHLGDIEVCRALAKNNNIKSINALVFHEHAVRFQQIMSEIAPESKLNLISVSEITPDVAILLQDKIQSGEWVAIVGDRIAVSSSQTNSRRITYSPFLGALAPFPQGPFILSALLKCPVLLMFALKEQGKIRIYCEEFANPIVLPRNTRNVALQTYIDQYAQRLEHYALISPLDWFNFYPFWQLPADPTSTEEKQ